MLVEVGGGGGGAGMLEEEGGGGGAAGMLAEEEEEEEEEDPPPPPPPQEEEEEEEEVTFALGAVVTLKGLSSQGTIVAVYMVPAEGVGGVGKPRLAYSVRYDTDPRRVERDVLGKQLQAAPNGRRRRVVDFRALAGKRP